MGEGKNNRKKEKIQKNKTKKEIEKEDEGGYKRNGGKEEN